MTSYLEAKVNYLCLLRQFLINQQLNNSSHIFFSVARLSYVFDIHYFTETVFSTSSESIRSGVSIASGFTKRLSAFRRSLAPKVQETAVC